MLTQTGLDDRHWCQHGSSQMLSFIYSVGIKLEFHIDHLGLFFFFSLCCSQTFRVKRVMGNSFRCQPTQCVKLGSPETQQTQIIWFGFTDLSLWTRQKQCWSYLITYWSQQTQQKPWGLSWFSCLGSMGKGGGVPWNEADSNGSVLSVHWLMIAESLALMIHRNYHGCRWLHWMVLLAQDLQTYKKHRRLWWLNCIGSLTQPITQTQVI